jgi:hypothetical protein
VKLKSNFGNIYWVVALGLIWGGSGIAFGGGGFMIGCGVFMLGTIMVTPYNAQDAAQADNDKAT